MKKFYLILAAAAGMTLASCTSNEYVGEVDPNAQVNDGSIRFGYEFPNATRANISGQAAATLLGNGFYVTGTKGTEANDSPTPTLVFDNYLVHYGINTAGTTESNTANWEYVGVTPGEGTYTQWVKLGTASPQSIKYWDYSASQYDFLAFSTGTYSAVSKTTYTGTDPLGATEIGVTASKYGTNLKDSKIAYTFYLPNVNALKQTYVTDITEVLNANYGQEVTLKFKNLGSKVRVALYETVPGYAVTDVWFYQEDGVYSIYKGSNNYDANDTPAQDAAKQAAKSTAATLISANSDGLPTNGTIQVFFPRVGNNNASAQDYDKVAGHVTAATVAEGGTYAKYQGFGELSNFAATKEGPNMAAGNYLGRTLPEATYAGSSAASYYQTVFPVASDALTLRVDYTLVSVDGSGEEIHVYGAKAVVPSTYVNWLPNYAYTYIFKISDNTNGWTTATGATTANQGLYPITFDAVVAEATDATGQQTTITTVAAPTITTYQQNHKETYPDEYKGAGSSTAKDIYVQVMDNSAVPATLVTTLSATNSLLYAVSDADATEALVMDALQQRTTAIDAANVTGRNSLTLTKNSYISNEVDLIENGADNQPIDLRNKDASGDPIDDSGHGKAAKITIGSLAEGTYAYVYDYTPAASTPKTVVTEFQPIAVTVDGTSKVGVSGKTYKSIAVAHLGTTTTALNEPVDNDYIYFSKTTNGTGTTTYSYVSVAGKTTLPEGLIKVAKNDSHFGTATGGTTVAAEDTFYFDTYFTNNGKYAVKVIKIKA